jgi:hypothetical protein
MSVRCATPIHLVFRPFPTQAPTLPSRQDRSSSSRSILGLFTRLSAVRDRQFVRSVRNELRTRHHKNIGMTCGMLIRALGHANLPLGRGERGGAVPFAVAIHRRFRRDTHLELRALPLNKRGRARHRKQFSRTAKANDTPRRPRLSCEQNSYCRRC